MKEMLLMKIVLGDAGDPPDNPVIELLVNICSS